jgi:hypothetical protein
MLAIRVRTGNKARRGVDENSDPDWIYALGIYHSAFKRSYYINIINYAIHEVSQAFV